VQDGRRDVVDACFEAHQAVEAQIGVGAGSGLSATFNLKDAGLTGEQRTGHHHSCEVHPISWYWLDQQAKPRQKAMLRVSE
jgi:hypothetical protein